MTYEQCAAKRWFKNGQTMVQVTLKAPGPEFHVARGDSTSQKGCPCRQSEALSQWIAAAWSGLPKGRANRSQSPRSVCRSEPDATARGSFAMPQPSPRPGQAVRD